MWGLIALHTTKTDIKTEVIMKQRISQDNFTININDDNSVEVTIDGVKADNTKEALRQIAEKKGIQFDNNWNTQTFGKTLCNLLSNKIADSCESTLESDNKFIVFWFKLERKIESLVANGVHAVAWTFRTSKLLGIFAFYIVLYAYAAIVLVSPLYYLIKLVIRIALLIKKQYVYTPEKEKSTLSKAVKKVWEEYSSWKSSHKILGFLGIIYLWVFVAYLLFLLAFVYIPYSLIRGILETTAKVRQ